MAETKSRARSAKGGTKSDETAGLFGFSEEELRTILSEMLLYRRFEEKAEEAYAIGKIGGFCHLHIGQEGVAAGAIKPLRPDDYVMSAYREHTQAIAKGVDPKRVMAELYGRVTGASRGKGGSMHIFGAEERFMGGHGIVGGQIPLATGIGWAIKYRGGDQVSMVFMGDAAVNQGAFHESKNMAAVWDLPVIFVVENNHYGMGTAFGRVSDVELHERARGYGMPVTSVNGQDVLATYRHFEKVVQEVREGSGPQFVEVTTYRFKGHSMSDPVSGTYRSREEVEKQIEQGDPIEILRARMMDAGMLTEEELKEIDAKARADSQAAADFADESPFPGPEELYEHVYAEVNEHGRLFFDGRERS
jgi:pyruvate dehydrogenase E1 component alpha subunit